MCISIAVKITEYWKTADTTVTSHIKALLLVISRHFDIWYLLFAFCITCRFPCTLGLLRNIFFCEASLVSRYSGTKVTFTEKNWWAVNRAGEWEGVQEIKANWLLIGTTVVIARCWFAIAQYKVYFGLVWLTSNHMFGSSNFWYKFFETFEISLFLLRKFQNFQKCTWVISQIALPNMWFLVLTDLVNKLYDIEKLLISFYAICY